MSIQYWFGREDAATVVLNIIKEANNIKEARTIIEEKICEEKQKLLKMKPKKRSYYRGLVVGIKKIYVLLQDCKTLEEAITSLKEMETSLEYVKKIEKSFINETEQK